VDAGRQLSLPDPRVTRVIADYGSRSAQGPGGDWVLPPAVLILNKVDTVEKEHRTALLPMADAFREVASFEEVFWASALRGHSMPQLREYLVGRAIPGEWLLHMGEATDRGDADVALEVVREKIFRKFYQGEEGRWWTMDRPRTLNTAAAAAAAAVLSQFILQ
jgi:50S ribosomal subunit-associated GTPase HflX